MRLSINWLKEFVDLGSISPQELAEKLTLHAFEVENIETVGPKLKGPIIIGKILEVHKHPNADKLSITKVTTDGKNCLQIVCGAKNIRAEQLVPISLPGSIVVNSQNGGEMGIKTSSIRGVDSMGMLCSPIELGLSSEVDGILILPDNAAIGEDIINYLFLRQDVVLEVAARSNRGDALSVYGLSKEITAITGKKLKQIELKEPKIDKDIKVVKSFIEDEKETYLFYTATIENIKICESPSWLKSLLRSVNIRSINNIVDITNYINFTFGQPMHAYDKAKLKGSKLISRRSLKNERILTLDGNLRELPEDTLIISDEANPQAIAGIMGGKESEVSETTKDIVFEVAVFSPVKVRKASRAVGLSSEASKRFERGVNSNLSYKALLRAIELIQEIAKPESGYVKIGEICKSGNEDIKKLQLNINLTEIERVLGIKLSLIEVKNILTSLDFEVKDASSNKELEVLIPPARVSDINREIDVIEEVARLYGYDKAQPTPPPSTICADKQLNLNSFVKNHFLGYGFSEVYLSSLIGKHALSNKEFPFNEDIAVKMLNPLSQEHSVMRQSLLPGLIEALRLNQSYVMSPIKLFEIGKTYHRDKGSKISDKSTSVIEKLYVSGISNGLENSWLNPVQDIKDSTLLFFDLKGVLESLFKKSRIKLIFIPTNRDYLHPKMSLKVETINGLEVGIMGCLNPLLVSRLKISGTVIMFELLLDPVLKNLELPIAFEKISSMPAVSRDITFDVEKKILSREVYSSIEKLVSGFVVDIKLISVYELDERYKSLTYRLKMQSFEETLTSEKVEEEIVRVKEHISSCLNARFRI